MKYYFEKKIHADFESAVKKTEEALKSEGFGILSVIDIHEKLKEKLNVDFHKYRILGACNPALAYQALQKENKIGTMLPCNVIVQELSENEIEVAAVDPVASMTAVENEELGETAQKVRQKLQKVIEMVGA
jgi:uncharacterized protein (DUF302 family)